MKTKELLYLMRSILVHGLSILVIISAANWLIDPENFSWYYNVRLSLILAIILHLIQYIILLKNHYPVGDFFRTYEISAYVKPDPDKNPIHHHDLALKIQKALNARKMIERDNSLVLHVGFHLNSLGALVSIAETESPLVLKITSRQSFSIFEWGQDFKNLKIIANLLGQTEPVNYK
jgi:hypothetical protein